ncbi:MAG: hypothetical protein N4A76_15615 [Firmicutes bacterium]|jgi:hypothetical protein|nr:hypothetical protein [Bacillota bacterium]
MRVIKFSLNENHYDKFKELCVSENITVKKKLNVLVAQDKDPKDIDSYFPEDANIHTKHLTLKVNEELYKGIIKNSDKYDIKIKKYVQYLIYKYLKGQS